MKKIFVLTLVLLNLSTALFSCTLADLPFCENMDFYENIFSGVISESSDNGVTIHILENFKGTESRTSIKVWDGVVGDCNGIPESAFTKYYGAVGDTVIFALSAPIQNVELTWEVVGDYRKPINFYEYPDLWYPEFVKVENNVLHIEDPNTTYTYDEMLAYLYSGDCITNVNKPELCKEIVDPSTLPWLQNLIDGNRQDYAYLECDCNDVIIQYCYNNEVYFNTTPLSTNCADNQSFIFDADGNVVCIIGGLAGGGPCTLPEGYAEGAEFMGIVYSCNENCGCSETMLSPVCGVDGQVYKNECFAICAGTDVEKEGACDESLCNDFTFTNTAVNCDAQCGDYLAFDLIGGDGNYVVENGGIIVNSGDPVVYIFPGNNSANLTAIDGNGCLTEVAIPAGPCISPPYLGARSEGICIGNDLFTVDVYINGNEGTNYSIGINQLGEEVTGTPGDVVNIALVSSDFENRVQITNLENGCVTNAFLRLEAPDCSNSINNCAVENFIEDLPWLAELIENADGCEVGSVEQFSYNGSDYIKVNPYTEFPYYNCPSDFPTKVYNCSGDLICTIGGYGLQLKRKTDNLYLDECDDALSNAAENGTLLWTYSDDCNNLQFDFITSDCNNCCEEMLNYSISGGSGNYEVSTLEGDTVYNGMPLIATNIFDGTVLLVTDEMGCTAEGEFEISLLCCEVAPACYLNGLSYDCNTGLQLLAGDFCDFNVAFTDEAGNSYQLGDSLPNGTYNLTNSGHPISPPCASYEVTVNCNLGCSDPLELELVQNAVNSGCTEAIYAFDIDSTAYVYINKTCNDVNVLHNCSTGETCELSIENTCGLTSAEVIGSITNENLIWSKPCNYEAIGTITWVLGNCPADCSAPAIAMQDSLPIIAYDQSILYDFEIGQTVEFTYATSPPDYYFYSSPGYSNIASIICIRETDADPYLKYPWLTNFVNPETCSVKATEHRYSASYTFVFIADADGSGRLYFQDGTLYCDGQIDECLSLYNLPNPGNPLFDCTTGNNQLTVNLNNLTCSDDGRFTVEITVTDSIDTSTNGEYGIYNVYEEGSPEYIYFAEGETIIYEGNSDDSTNSLYTVFVFDRNLADVGAQGVQINTSACQVSDFPFDKYPWLQDLIDTNNCDADNKTTEYDFGFYSFVFVENNDGGKLYFEDGTFYCASTPNYDCLELYDFKNPTSTWTCGSPTEDCEIDDPLNWAQTIGATDVWVYQFEGNTYYYAEYNVDSDDEDEYGPVVFDCNGEQVCLFCGPAVDRDEMELIWSDTSNDIFTTYPWLYTLVNPISCNNESIQVYTYGTYQFISIETNEGVNLYFQDGTFYCADGFNYSCTQLYGLETPQNEWLCEGVNQKSAKPSSSKKIDFDAYFKIYPNPSNGQFTVQLSNQLKNEAILKVMDVQGKLLQSLKLKDGQQTVPVNLEVVAGMYRLQLVSDKILSSQNLIIH